MYSSALVRLTLTFSYAPHIFVSVTPGSLTRWTRTWAFLPPLVVYGRPTTSHSPHAITDLELHRLDASCPRRWGRRHAGELRLYRLGLLALLLRALSHWLVWHLFSPPQIREGLFDVCIEMEWLRNSKP